MVQILKYDLSVYENMHTWLGEGNQCIFELGECNLVNPMISGISAGELNSI